MVGPRYATRPPFPPCITEHYVPNRYKRKETGTISFACSKKADTAALSLRSIQRYGYPAVYASQQAYNGTHKPAIHRSDPFLMVCIIRCASFKIK